MISQKVEPVVAIFFTEPGKGEGRSHQVCKLEKKRESEVLKKMGGEGKMYFTFPCPAHLPLAKEGAGVGATKLQETWFRIIAIVKHLLCARHFKYVFSFLLTINK